MVVVLWCCVCVGGWGGGSSNTSVYHPNYLLHQPSLLLREIQGKSCTSNRLASVPLVKFCTSNRLASQVLALGVAPPQGTHWARR